ncbi:uncharacterized protein VTP21DRAFT_6883 [Calcarisporiella thermophila]|uniref:uncharacterized protein n=1 Tax=Calcarisporiella thermophila TaxID=911321 RepID=UPI0037437303
MLYELPGEIFDTASSLLVINNRYLDLKQGRFVETRPNHYITHSVPTYYDSEVDLCHDTGSLPLVDEFMNSLFEDREADERVSTISSLQTFLGYSLTGEASEHLSLILYGEGRNGKGVLTRAIRAVFDIADERPIQDASSTQILKRSELRQMLAYPTHDELLTQTCPIKRRYSVATSQHFLYTIVDNKLIAKTAKTSKNAHTTQPVSLVGARVVLVNELDVNAQLDEAKLERLSNGDPLCIRKIYGRTTFTISSPTHTLLIDTSTIPNRLIGRSLSSHTRVLRFNLYFNANKKPGDPLNTNERVADTWMETKILDVSFRRQLLRWLLRGAHRYYQQGRLRWAKSIEQDTRAFWGEDDYFDRFLIEKCEMAKKLLPLEEAIQRKLYTPAFSLYDRFRNYVREQGNVDSANILSKKAFICRLGSQPYIFKKRTAQGELSRQWHYFGLHVLE